jgi:alpha-tubulin suppressor-like RCC1 family protein
VKTVDLYLEQFIFRKGLPIEAIRPKDFAVAAQSGVTAIAAGFSHTVALKADGSVLVWESYATGQAEAAVPADAQRGVMAIAAGGAQTVALKTDGSILAWEYNELGPTILPLPELKTVTAVAAGGYITSPRPAGMIDCP